MLGVKEQAKGCIAVQVVVVAEKDELVKCKE